LVWSVGKPRSPSEGACGLPAGAWAVAGLSCGAAGGLAPVCAKDGNEAMHRHTQVSAVVLKRIVFTVLVAFLKDLSADLGNRGQPARKPY
jgi:hypothetical protein